MKTFFSIIATTILLASCSELNQDKNEDPNGSYNYIVNNRFAFNIPETNTMLDSLLEKAQAFNENIVFLSLVNLPDTKQKEISFSVSCYSGQEPVSMDTIFYNSTVNYVSDPVGDYQARPYSYSKYEKEGKTFYRKMSTSDDIDLNLMYYKMKDNFDSSYYEMKLCGIMADSTIMINFMERVMGSSAFVD
ncbi:MAG: hypothetical protein ACU4F9_09910 [Arcticibacter sp.]